MIIEHNGNTTLITQDSKNTIEFVKQLTQDYTTYKNNNLIINISGLQDTTIDAIVEFLQLSNTHRGSKKSFVIIAPNMNSDDIPDELVIVPTLQEAYDIIEMEDIERDLGF